MQSAWRERHIDTTKRLHARGCKSCVWKAANLCLAGWCMSSAWLSVLLMLLLLLASAAAWAVELSVGDCPLLCAACSEDKLFDGWTASVASEEVAGVVGVGRLRLHCSGC